MSKALEPSELRLREVASLAPWSNEAIARLVAAKDHWQMRALAAERLELGWQPIEDHDGSDTPVDLWRDGERLIDFSFGKRGWTKTHGYPAVTTVLASPPSHFMQRPSAPA